MTDTDKKELNSPFKTNAKYEEVLQNNSRTTQTTLEGKITWDFLRSFSIKESHEFTHGLHIYPAKIVPQIARELIAKLSNPYDTVLDPFCGSGTVLVESLIANRNSIGIDINNLALLLAKVKTTIIPKEETITTMQSILKHAEEETKNELEPSQRNAMEKIPNIYHWFQPHVAKHLWILKNEILNIKDNKIQDFFKACFSATMYSVSNIRKADNPYFIRILHKEEIVKHKPNVLKQFASIVKKNSKAIESISKFKEKNAWVNIIRMNTQDLESQIGKETVDLIVTSPPYGEEKNTMDYTRFSKLALYWLGLDGQHIKDVKKEALGSSPREWEDCGLSSETLQKKLEEIARKSKKRANEVYSFFYDYTTCLKRMFNVLKTDCNCCIVIGDRTASGIPIPNGKITSELCEAIGFATKERLERKMYMRTLRSNIIGSENILIIKKV